MKIRIFRRIEDGVINVMIRTEDWSELERDLMVKFGEPMINLGGVVDPVVKTAESSGSGSSGEDEPVILDDRYVRVMTESPFTYKFDVRDYGMERAYQVADGWVTEIVARIEAVVEDLRRLQAVNPAITTEEIVEF